MDILISYGIMKPTHTILFLDIDGVIVTDRSHYSTGKIGVMVEPDMVAVNAITKFCFKKPALIVVSSTWAKVDKLSLGCLLQTTRLDRFLWNGIEPYDWHTRDGTDSPAHHSFIRGYEIKEWLERHPEYKSNYLILEDNWQELLPEQQTIGHLIKCDPSDGMDSGAIRSLMKMAGYY
jgi:hypothetical protein